MRQGHGDRQHQCLELRALGADQVGTDHRLAVAGREPVQGPQECGEAEGDEQGPDTTVGVGDQIRERINPSPSLSSSPGSVVGSVASSTSAEATNSNVTEHVSGFSEGSG